MLNRKDFFDAIRGKYKNEPNSVKITDSDKDFYPSKQDVEVKNFDELNIEMAQEKSEKRVNQRLMWKYTEAVGTPYELQVPEHEGTLWGKSTSNRIYNFEDLDDENTLEYTVSMNYEGTICYIHPYKTQSGDRKIAFVTRDTTSYITRAYLADGMDDENPEKVLEDDTEGAYPQDLSCDSYFDGLNNVVLIGQYGTGGNKKKLFASFDGGKSYNVIKETTNNDPDRQSHWHVVHYDRFSNRIWAGEGDGQNQNAAINWTDDNGETWHRKENYQPTLIKSFSNCVVFGYDQSAENAGLYKWDRNNKDNRSEIELERILTVNEESSINYYPRNMLFAQRDDLAYLLFIRTDGSTDSEYIYASNGGTLWTGAGKFKRDKVRIDHLGGITKQGHIVGRLRESPDDGQDGFNLVYAKVTDEMELD